MRRRNLEQLRDAHAAVRFYHPNESILSGGAGRDTREKAFLSKQTYQMMGAEPKEARLRKINANLGEAGLDWRAQPNSNRNMVVYKNSKGEFHIAHRGSAKMLDVGSDALISLGIESADTKRRRKQSKRIIDSINDPDARVTASGHSYGGATVQRTNDPRISEIKTYNAATAPLYDANRPADDRTTHYRTSGDVVSGVATATGIGLKGAKTMGRVQDPLTAHSLDNWALEGSGKNTTMPVDPPKPLLVGDGKRKRGDEVVVQRATGKFAADPILELILQGQTPNYVQHIPAIRAHIGEMFGLPEGYDLDSAMYLQDPESTAETVQDMMDYQEHHYGVIQTILQMPEEQRIRNARRMYDGEIDAPEA